MNVHNIGDLQPAGGSATPALSSAKAWLRALEMTVAIAGRPTFTLPVMIEELAEKFGAAPALLSDHENFTFRELAERSNRYSRWALGQGLTKGNVMCLLMPNRPEYMAIWLGVTRVGGVVSLINTNLVGAGLAHCINVVHPAHIIVAAELADTFASARDHLTGNANVWPLSETAEDMANIAHDIGRLSGKPLTDAERQAVTVADQALYIYTSGTTGLPKAAKVTHHRLLTWSYWFAGMMDTRTSDRMYNCLPMYHSVGGVVATGAVLVNGGSVVVREKFSASRFWDDVVRYDCTLFQYIGELCRYLVHSPPHPAETQHHLRLCCGNGLRPDIWNEFKSRFRIPQILEFYAATEGNVTMFNYEGKPGAIGRIPSFITHRSPTALVKLDIESGEPMRRSDGFCMRCEIGEAGEAIGRITTDGSNPGARFDGYTDHAASEKKILRNVFKAGDTWYRTGDLMRKDASGYFYFVDRIGETFRWKGENVSTTEVCEAISAFPRIAEACVYGVAIPGTDGRAGMATIVIEGTIDLAAFRSHLIERLPEYAQPIFLRVSSEIATTATFKRKKHDLTRESYNPTASNDPIYYRDPERQVFVRLDAAFYDRIQAGGVRL